MKHPHFSLPVTLGLIILICAIIFLIVTNSKSFEEQADDERATTTQPTIDQNADYTEQYVIKEENTEATIDMSYPVNAPKEVKEFLEDALLTFRALSMQEKFVDVPYIFSGNVEVYEARPYTSFVVTTYEYTGGANGNGYVQSFVYQEGERVSVEQVVDIETRSEDILKAIYTHLNDLRGFEISAEEREELKVALEDTTVLGDFYVTTNTYGFIFSEYEISYGAVGIIDIQIARESAETTPSPAKNAGSFDSCLDNRGLIMESYPRQCQDSTGTYTEIIVPQEEKGDGVVMEVTVGPEKKRCVGTSAQECLVVDGLLFYDSIEGFEFEEGFEHRLQIERTLAFDTTNPMSIPADVSLYKFVLTDVLEKIPVSDAVTCVIAGCSSQLCISQQELNNGGGISTCEFREEYACYPAAACEVQISGECGWTMSDELVQCLENPPVLQ